MSLSRIHRVLSTLTSRRVQHLLMGGQACVLYGAAEFSRDTDIALLAEPENLDRLSQALADLRAEVIAVPPFRLEYLERGHACHFRCHRPEADGMRLDVMAVMRNVESFPALWSRRTTVELEPALRVDLMSVRDLVCAKKTQRDKDWLMLRRLVEAHHAEFAAESSADHVRFWLRESRTPEMLVELAQRHRDEAAALAAERPLLVHAGAEEWERLHDALSAEERRERELDREYWRPLRRELEELRRVKARAVRRHGHD